MVQFNEKIKIMNHACGGYTAGDDSKAMLVVGGFMGGSGRESATEMVEIKMGDGDAPGSTPRPTFTRLGMGPIPNLVKGNRIANLYGVLYNIAMHWRRCLDG